MWWRKAAAGIAAAGAIAGTAPVVPYDEKAVMWYEPTPGAEICYQRYADGTEKPFACDEYWRIANTPYYPQPERVRLVSLFSATQASAAIVEDTVSSTTYSTGASSLSWSHTVNSGSNSIIIAACTILETSTALNTDSVTYNGDSLSNIRRDETLGPDIESSLFYLLVPDTGTLTVTATFASASDRSRCAAQSLFGVDQTTPVEDHGGTGTGLSNSLQVSTTVTSTDGAWIIDAMNERPTTGTLTPGASQTQLYQSDDAGGHTGATSKWSNAPASDNSLTWTSTSASSDWTHSVASFKPAGAAPPPATPAPDPGIIFFD